MANYNYNKVILIGNIAQDLELRYIQSGTAVVRVRLAVTEKFKSSNGERREKNLFIDVDVWGRSAEVICEYSGKGRCILVEGTLELDTWTDRDGNKRSKHKVRCDRFVFMDTNFEGGSGGGSRGSSQSDRSSQGAPPQQQQQQQQQSSQQQSSSEDEPPFPPEQPDDDIPF